MGIINDRKLKLTPTARPMSEDLAKLISKINAFSVDMRTEGLLWMGAMILDVVFHGDVFEAMSRNPHKLNSISMLSRDPSLKISRRRLSEWVRAATVKRVLSARSIDHVHLRYSHFLALSNITDTKRQCQLAQEANQKRMGARALIRVIQQEKTRERG